MINSNNSSSNSNHSIIILEMIILGKTVINIISIEHPLRADCTTINSAHGDGTTLHPHTPQ